jgi:hypothetical protein
MNQLLEGLAYFGFATIGVLVIVLFLIIPWMIGIITIFGG